MDEDKTNQFPNATIMSITWSPFNRHSPTVTDFNNKEDVVRPSASRSQVLMCRWTYHVVFAAKAMSLEGASHYSDPPNKGNSNVRRIRHRHLFASLVSTYYRYRTEAARLNSSSSVGVKKTQMFWIIYGTIPSSLFSIYTYFLPFATTFWSVLLLLLNKHRHPLSMSVRLHWPLQCIPAEFLSLGDQPRADEAGGLAIRSDATFMDCGHYWTKPIDTSRANMMMRRAAPM